MAERKEFEMTEEDLKSLIEACRSVPYMVFGGMAPPSPQESANRAWRNLGERMGFDGMSVEPAGNNPRKFTALVGGSQALVGGGAK